MQARFLAVVLVLIVLSGCSGTGESLPETTPESTAVGTPTVSQSAPTTAVPSTSATRTTEADTPENPWNKAPIVVGIRYDNDSYPDRSRLVSDAVRFWETDGEPYATWKPSFEVEPDATNPDVVVEFKDRIDRCELDHPGRVAGCASVLRPRSDPEHPEVIEVVPGTTRYYTREILKHEFGHVLGLEHGDEPIDVMDRSFVPFSRDRSATYHVYIEHPDGYAGDDRSRENIRHALDYYEEGAEGWMRSNVTFEYTDDEGAADVRVEVSKRSPAGSVSDFRARTIRLDGLPSSRHGWHVGYWIGFLFGADSIEELPPAFDEPNLDDRQDWW